MPDPDTIREARLSAEARYARVLDLPDRQRLPAMAEMGRDDLYFLLVVVLGRRDLRNDWFYARCREVEAAPDGHLDLWAREHGKSSIQTYGQVIRDILNDPEVTIAIFSYKKDNAVGQFLRPIKQTFEENRLLKKLYPEIFYEEPEKESPLWTIEQGLTVKRRTSRKEATVSAWGVIQGQPIGSHFDILVYDDIVTGDTVSEGMVAKATEAWSVSLNLGTIGGRTRMIGTRWALADTYATVIDRQAAIPRIKPATDDGTIHGEPVFMSREELEKRLRMQGSSAFCFPGETPILMADGSERRIAGVKAGDTVVGFTFGENHKTSGQYVPAKVRATGSRDAEVWEFGLENGLTVRCTRDHQWYTGRSEGERSERRWCRLGMTRGDNDRSGIRTLRVLYDALPCPDPELAAWLAGFFDGEGCISCGPSRQTGVLAFSQSPEANPETCAKLERALDVLGMSYGVWNRAAEQTNGRNNRAGRTYYITGGRDPKIRLCVWGNPAKAPKIMDKVIFGGLASKKRKIVSMRKAGTERVYNIETETGNYIAWGGLAKNSAQMLLDPKADSELGFQEQCIRYYRDHRDGHGMNLYLLVDPANSRKRESSYTALMLVGLGWDGNYYWLDGIRDRIGLDDRIKAVFAMHRAWQSRIGLQRRIVVGYECYGTQAADLEMIAREQERQMYRFPLVELRGRENKNDRIAKLEPDYIAGRWYWPERLARVRRNGQHYDLVQEFKVEEFLSFPFGRHPDCLDAKSRILDPVLGAVFPKPQEFPAADRYDEKDWDGPATSPWAA